MVTTGILETLARADLDAVVEEWRGRYRPGALDSLTAQDPEWRAALDRAEAEVGGLYQDLRAADATFGRWRRAVGELRRLSARLAEVEPADQVA